MGALEKTAAVTLSSLSLSLSLSLARLPPSSVMHKSVAHNIQTFTHARSLSLTSSVTRSGDLLDFGPLLKLWQQLFSPTFLGNFCKGVKIHHFCRNSFLGNIYRHLAIFSGHTADKHANTHSCKVQWNWSLGPWKSTTIEGVQMLARLRPNSTAS